MLKTRPWRLVESRAVAFAFAVAVGAGHAWADSEERETKPGGEVGAITSSAQGTSPAYKEIPIVIPETEGGEVDQAAAKEAIRQAILEALRGSEKPQERAAEGAPAQPEGAAELDEIRKALATPSPGGEATRLARPSTPASEAAPSAAD